MAQRQAGVVTRDEHAIVVEKVQQRLVLMTPAHLVAGDVHVHAGGSLLHFVDSPDPRFIPMSDVRIRWLDDRTLAGRFDFALVSRAKILGVATEGLGGGAEEAPGTRRAAVGHDPAARPEGGTARPGGGASSPDAGTIEVAAD